VLDDPTRRRTVVVRRDDEEPVHTELVRALGQVDGMSRRVRAGGGDDCRAVADLVHRGGVQLEALLVVERRALPRRAGDD
jgi:hypothetical protein